VVKDVEAVFAARVFEADRRLGYAQACRPFFQFWDDSPRKQAVAALLREVNLTLSGRFVGAGSFARHGS
jgi:hypothetical protein